MVRYLAIHVRVSVAVEGLEFIQHANSAAGGVSGIYIARRVGSRLQTINGLLRRLMRVNRRAAVCGMLSSLARVIKCQNDHSEDLQTDDPYLVQVSTDLGRTWYWIPRSEFRPSMSFIGTYERE